MANNDDFRRIGKAIAFFQVIFIKGVGVYLTIYSVETWADTGNWVRGPDHEPLPSQFYLTQQLVFGAVSSSPWRHFAASGSSFSR